MVWSSAYNLASCWKKRGTYIRYELYFYFDLAFEVNNEFISNMFAAPSRRDELCGAIPAG